MLLGVVGLICRWTDDELLFVRNVNLRSKRAAIDSFYTLYTNYPDIMPMDIDNSTYRLYDTASSELNINRKLWGLYEVVTVSVSDNSAHQSRILGLEKHTENESNFWYGSTSGMLTLTGNTNLQGNCHFTSFGIEYGYLGSTYFSGTKINPKNIETDNSSIPQSARQVSVAINALLNLHRSKTSERIESPVSADFRDKLPMYITVGDTMLTDKSFSGMITILGDRISISPTCQLNDILIVANSITVQSGFRGSAQLFASDTIIIQSDVVLEYPSGIYSKLYSEIGGQSQVNGYAIVASAHEANVKQPNYRQSLYARVRGLLYVDGIAHIQGVVNGAAYIHEATHYIDDGYYRDLICDATILKNDLIAWPLYFKTVGDKKEIKWVR